MNLGKTHTRRAKGYRIMCAGGESKTLGVDLLGANGTSRVDSYPVHQSTKGGDSFLHVHRGREKKFLGGICEREG